MALRATKSDQGLGGEQGGAKGGRPTCSSPGRSRFGRRRFGGDECAQGEADREVRCGLKEKQVASGVEGVAERSSSEFTRSQHGASQREPLQAGTAAQAAN